jgi:hypothetical protein
MKDFFAKNPLPTPPPGFAMPSRIAGNLAGKFLRVVVWKDLIRPDRILFLMLMVTDRRVDSDQPAKRRDGGKTASKADDTPNHNPSENLDDEHGRLLLLRTREH